MLGFFHAAGLDGEFFFAVQDPVAGVLDDDGDELAGVAGAELLGCLLTMIRPLACTLRRAAIDPAGSGAGGSGVAAARAPAIRAARPAVTGAGPGAVPRTPRGKC